MSFSHAKRLGLTFKGKPATIVDLSKPIVSMTPAEEHRAFTANCSSWVSSSQKGVSPDGSGELREILIP